MSGDTDTDPTRLVVDKLLCGTPRRLVARPQAAASSARCSSRGRTPAPPRSKASSVRTPPPRDSLLLFSARLSPPPTARPSYRLPNTHTHTPAGDPNLLELFLAESSQLLAAAAFDDASLAPGPSTVAAALRRLAAQERSLRVELALADREQADWEEEFAGSGGGRAGSSAGATVA